MTVSRTNAVKNAIAITRTEGGEPSGGMREAPRAGGTGQRRILGDRHSRSSDRIADLRHRSAANGANNAPAPLMHRIAEQVDKRQPLRPRSPVPCYRAERPRARKDL